MAKLSKDERAALEEWSPGFLGMPVHRELEHQMELCRKGIEDAIVVGPRGVGKTEAVKRFCDRMRAGRSATDDRRSVPPAGGGPVLRSLAGHRAQDGSPRPVQGAVRRRRRGWALDSSRPPVCRDHIADEVQRRNVRLICIDEAQLIDAANLDLLRQVPDAARSRGHVMGLMLIGNEELRDSLVAIRQMGQRFSAEVKFHRISRKSVART